MKTLLGLAVGTAALAVAASPALADERCVGTTPAGIDCESTHASIQLAVDAALNDDTILVGPSDPAIDWLGATVTGKTGLIFRGAQFNASASGGRPGPESVVSSPLTVTGGGTVRVDGFTFEQGVTLTGAVGDNLTNRGQVTNNIFSGGAGLSVGGTSVPGTPYEIARNDFSGQTAAGVTITDADVVDVRQNRIANSPAAVLMTGTNSMVRIFDNSIAGNTDYGVDVNSGSTGTLISGNTITGPTGPTTGIGVRVGTTASDTRITANRMRYLVDINAASGATVDATNNWYGSNGGPTTGTPTSDVIGSGVTSTPYLTLGLTANPTSTPSDTTSAIGISMMRGGPAPGPVETDFPNTSVALETTAPRSLIDSEAEQGALITTGLTDGIGGATLSSGGQTGPATVMAALDSVGPLSTQVTFTAPPTTGGGGGGTTTSPPGGGTTTTPSSGGGTTITPRPTTTTRLGLRLAVQSGRRARVGGRVVFGVAANQVVRGRRIVLQRAVRVRSGGRTRIVYRNITAATLNGRAGRITVRFAKRGKYAMRVAFREGAQQRRTNAVGLTIRPALRR